MSDDKPWLWKPGQSGNPKGGPTKERAFTKLLERALSATVQVGDARLSRKRLAAELAAEMLSEGKATLPDGTVIKLEGKDLMDIYLKFLNHLDGPAPGANDFEGKVTVVWDAPRPPTNSQA